MKSNALCLLHDLAAFLLLQSNSEKFYASIHDMAICLLHFKTLCTKNLPLLRAELNMCDEHTPFLFPSLQLGGWKD